MTRFFSLEAGFLTSLHTSKAATPGEHRLCAFAETPKPQPEGEQKKPDEGEKKKETPEEKKKREAEELKKQAEQRTEDPKAKQAAELINKQPEGETQLDKMSNAISQAMKEFDEIPDGPDANKKKLVLIMKTLALIIDMIKRAFDGTLGNTPEDDKLAAEAAAAKPAEAGAQTPAAAVQKDVNDKNADGTPEGAAKAAAEVEADRKEQGKENTEAIARYDKSIADSEKDRGELATRKDSVDAQIKDMEAKKGDPETITALKKESEQLGKQIALADEHLAELKQERDNLKKKGERIAEETREAEKIVESTDKLMPVLQEILTKLNELLAKLGSDAKISVAIVDGKPVINVSGNAADPAKVAAAQTPGATTNAQGDVQIDAAAAEAGAAAGAAATEQPGATADTDAPEEAQEPAETVAETPEARAAELNEKIAYLREKAEIDHAVLENSALCRALIQVTFSVDPTTKDLEVSLPGEYAEDVIRLAKSIGWEHDEKTGEVKGDGKTVNVKGDAPITMDSEIAFGGKPGDVESQYAMAAEGIAHWQALLQSPDAKRPTTVLALDEVEQDEEFIDAMQDDPLNADLTRIKENMSDAVADKTLLGKVLGSMRIKRDGDSVVLVSDLPLNSGALNAVYTDHLAAMTQEIGTSNGESYIKLKPGMDGRVASLLKKLEAGFTDVEQAPVPTEIPELSEEIKAQLTQHIEEIGTKIHDGDEPGARRTLDALNALVAANGKLAENEVLLAIVAGDAQFEDFESRQRYQLEATDNGFALTEIAETSATTPTPTPEETKPSPEVVQNEFDGMRDDIIRQLSAKGDAFASLAVDKLPTGADIEAGKATPEQFLIMYRELQKVAGADTEWGPIDTVGIAFNNTPYMYRLSADGATLQAFTPPQNYQELPLDAAGFDGKWKKVTVTASEEVADLQSAYAQNMKLTPEQVKIFAGNAEIERYLKNGGDKETYAQAKKDYAEAWNLQQNVVMQNVLDRLRGSAA